VGGAQGRAVVGNAVEDEDGRNGDADFARVEVGRVRDEFDVVRDCNGCLISGLY
jgi:hypothetical protein